MISGQLLQFGGSLIAILMLAGVSHMLRLGASPKISDQEVAASIANEVCDGFEPVEIAVDAEGRAALLRDNGERFLVIRQHGSRFAGRILASSASLTRSDIHLFVETGERRFGSLTLQIDNPDAWVKAFETSKVNRHA